MMRNSASFVLVALVSASSFAMAATTPTATDVKQALARLHPSPECWDIADVGQVNGEAPRINGITYYSYEYKALFRFVRPCYAIYDEAKKRLNGKAFVEKPDMHGMGAMFGVPRLFNAGQQLEARGRLTFKQGQAGWVLDR